jgi:hypothetical protein
MLETPEAIERASEIAAVPGVDVLHIGTTDLCDAMGIPGKFTDPAIERAFERVIAACRTHGKTTGAGGLGYGHRRHAKGDPHGCPLRNRRQRMGVPALGRAPARGHAA